MISVMLSLLLLLILPDLSLAWGPGFHLQLGLSVLDNLASLPPHVAAVIGRFPNDFLYGCIAADITIGKKYTGEWRRVSALISRITDNIFLGETSSRCKQECHHWAIAAKLLASGRTEAQQSCAYGYISHLAADTVAHSYYVPLSIMRSYKSVMLNHAYWEVRFDSFTPREVWETGRKVAQEHFQDNDALLRRVNENTLFPFSTNKKIFNSILLVSRLEKWQQLITAMNGVSRFQLQDEETAAFTALAEQAVMETLADLEGASWRQADPTGERALHAAGAVKKNLQSLFGNCKTTEESAAAALAEIKPVLADAITRPELLDTIHSPGKRSWLTRLRSASATLSFGNRGRSSFRPSR